MRLGLLALLIICVLGYFGSGLALQCGVAVPAILYWLFFLAIPSISFLLVSENEAYNVGLLLLNAVSVYSIYFLQHHTWYPAGRDTQFEIQIVSLIAETGKWVPRMGTSMSRETSIHPAMHIVLTSLCHVMGIEPYQAVFLVPWLKGVCYTLFFYIFSRHFLSNKKGTFFASVIVMGSLFLVKFPHRELFAEILIMGILSIILSKRIGFNKKALFMLLILSLATAHHFTSYLFLLLYGAIYLFSRRKTEMVHPLVPIIVVSAWVAFVSYHVASGYLLSFFEAFQTVLFFPGTTEPRTLAATAYYYTPFENILMLMNPLLVGVAVLPSFVRALKPAQRTREKTPLIVMTLLFGVFGVFLLMFFLYPTAWGAGFHRFFGFLYIPLSIWAGLTFFEGKKLPRVRLRTITGIAVAVLLFASMNLSDMIGFGIKKWYVPQGSLETYRFSDSMPTTAQWCDDHLNGLIIGDNLAFNFVGSWGYQEVYQYSFKLWYLTEDNDRLRRFDYIILSPWDPLTYSDTFREPIDPFALLPADLSIIYSSGDLIVYRISSQD